MRGGQLIEGVITELEPILRNAIRMLGLESSSPCLNKLQAELLAAGQFVYRRYQVGKPLHVQETRAGEQSLQFEGQLLGWSCCFLAHLRIVRREHCASEVV